MEQTISFPKLGIEFTMNRIALSFGNINIYWYGIIIACAFALGTLYLMLRAKEFKLDPDALSSALLFSTVGSIIGARLYYVIFSWQDYASDPIRIFKTWEGGLGIYGALIGAVVTAYISCRFLKLNFRRTMDLAAPALLLGQGIGRWGNFVNIEAFGTNTDLPWGMTSPVIQHYLAANLDALNEAGMGVIPMMPVHPTFLYESIWCILGAVILMIYTKRRRYDGQLFLLYLTWYSFGRFFIEGLRTDSLMLGSFRVSQLLAAVLFVVCGTLLIKNKDKRRVLEPDGPSLDGTDIEPGFAEDAEPEQEPEQAPEQAQESEPEQVQEPEQAQESEQSAFEDTDNTQKDGGIGDGEDN